MDGYTTATLKALVDFPSSFNGALQASRASSAADAGAAATGSTVSAGASASGGTEKPAAASVWEVYYRFNQRMMQYEYCLPSTALPSHSRPPPSAATAVSSDAVAIITTATHSSLASSASSAAAPAAVATIEAQASQQQVSAEWERQSALLCLDRVYLAKECGIDVDLDLGRSRKVLFHPSLPPGSDATTTAGAGADSAGESSNSASVAGLQPMLEASSDAVPAKRRRVSNSRYVQDEVLPSSPPTETAVAPSTAAVAASAAAGGSTQAEVNMEAAGSNSSSSARGALVIKPFSIADLIFRKYKEDALRKQG